MSTLTRWYVRQAPTKKQSDKMKWKKRCREGGRRQEENLKQSSTEVLGKRRRREEDGKGQKPKKKKKKKKKKNKNKKKKKIKRTK